MNLKDCPATLSWSLDKLLKGLLKENVEFKIHIEQDKSNEVKFVVTTREQTRDSKILSSFLRQYYGFQKK